MAPATIERASIAAYVLPWVLTANNKEASATDGAAPNKPANLLGLITSPSSAKPDTIAPPTTIRIRISRSIGRQLLALFSGFQSFFNTSLCGARPLYAEDSIFLAC